VPLFFDPAGCSGCEAAITDVTVMLVKSVVLAGKVAAGSPVAVALTIGP
jgi:hypothetical protein